MYKKFFVVIFLFLINNFEVKAQILSFNDLKYLCDNNIEKTDSFLLNKGFVIIESDVNDIESKYSWAFNRSIINSRASTFISKQCHSYSCSWIWVQLTSLEKYNKIREQCKIKGFKLIETKNDSFGNLRFIYKLGNYEISFTSGLNENNINEYFINLYKL